MHFVIRVQEHENLGKRIPDELEAQLEMLASRRGKTKSAIARDVLSRGVRKSADDLSVFYLMRDQIGIIETGVVDLASNSQAFGRVRSLMAHVSSIPGHAQWSRAPRRPGLFAAHFQNWSPFATGEGSQKIRELARLDSGDRELSARRGVWSLVGVRRRVKFSRLLACFGGPSLWRTRER